MSDNWSTQREQIIDWSKDKFANVQWLNKREPFEFEFNLPDSWPHAIWVMDCCDRRHLDVREPEFIDANFAFSFCLKMGCKNRRPSFYIHVGDLFIVRGATVEPIKRSRFLVNSDNFHVFAYNLFTGIGYCEDCLTWTLSQTDFTPREFDQALGAIHGKTIILPTSTLQCWFNEI